MKKQAEFKICCPKILAANSQSVPLFQDPISAGFPSVAEDYIENSLDLNELIIKHPASTFFVRVQGDSMRGAGILSGDILVVDRSLEASNNKIIVAIVNGEFTVKRLVLGSDGALSCSC